MIPVKAKTYLGTNLNVFDLDRALVTDYERFARSFTQIRAPDIRAKSRKFTRVIVSGPSR